MYKDYLVFVSACCKTLIVQRKTFKVLKMSQDLLMLVQSPVQYNVESMVKLEAQQLVIEECVQSNFFSKLEVTKLKLNCSCTARGFHSNAGKVT